MNANNISVVNKDSLSLVQPGNCVRFLNCLNLSKPASVNVSNMDCFFFQLNCSVQRPWTSMPSGSNLNGMRHSLLHVQVRNVKMSVMPIDTRLHICSAFLGDGTLGCFINASEARGHDFVLFNSQSLQPVTQVDDGV